MRIKLAFWMTPLALSLVLGVSRDCIGQSGFTNAATVERPAVAGATRSELVVAAVLPSSPDRNDMRSDDSATFNYENAASEEAEPAPKRPGQHTSSKIG